MTPPVISCIVPVYNGEAYLREAVESIFAQSYRPIEVIVADDGSNDGTPEIIDSYIERIISRRQMNSGPAATRNLGLDAASGALVAFLDADDLWHPDKLAAQMEYLDQHPEHDVCVTHIQNFWIPELAEEEVRFRDSPAAKAVPGYLTQTMLARRSAFERVGGFNTDAGAGDATDWFLRAGDAGVSCGIVPRTLVRRRLHHRNRSRTLGTLPRTVLLEFLKNSLDRRRGIEGDVR